MNTFYMYQFLVFASLIMWISIWKKSGRRNVKKLFQNSCVSTVGFISSSETHTDQRTDEEIEENPTSFS